MNAMSMLLNMYHLPDQVITENWKIHLTVYLAHKLTRLNRINQIVNQKLYFN